MEAPVHPCFRAGTAVCPPAFTAVVEKARVWGPDGVVLTPDDRVLADVSWEYQEEYLTTGRHSIYREWKPYPLTVFDGTAAVVTHASSRNYFHWLFDVVPRIGLTRDSGAKPDRYVICGGGPASYENEILDIIGVPPRRRLYTHERFHMRFGKLIVPSLGSRFEWDVYPRPLAYAGWACEYVRKALLPKGMPVPHPAPTRLFISRAGAPQRRLLNESEVAGRLLPLGFVTVDPGMLPVKEQIGLFAAAEAIVAPHGGGLANLAFCRPGTKVIELFSPLYTPGYYRMLSHHFGLDYYYLIGRSVAAEQIIWDGGKDYEADPGQLEALLRLAGIR